MEKLEIFKNKEFGEIRTLVVNGTPYFVGLDIANVLGYSNGSKAVSTHCKNGIKKMLDVATSQNGNVVKTQTTLIPEGDVYRLIIRSKLPSAEKFESWVMDEVLPTIRKTGGYVNSVDLMMNTYFSDIPTEQQGLVKGLLVNIQSVQKKNNCLKNENDLLAQKNLEWADRPLINSLVRAYAQSVDGIFATAWRDFKKEILYKHGINLNSRITNYLNTTHKKTKPKTLDMLADSELPDAISTIVAMCRENDVNIDYLLNNKAS